MTSEAPHPNSPPPTVSVRERAKEIEARTQAAGNSLSLAAGPPVESQEVTSKRYQVPKNIKSEQPPNPAGGHQSPDPSRRSSEGDIFLRCKVRQVPPPVPPKHKRVSLENDPPPAVPERRSTLGRLPENSEGSSSGELATATPCQTETTSKFASFAEGGKSGVTWQKKETDDFSSAIFSASADPPVSSDPPTPQSPLDDIIHALEKICDEFELPDPVTGRPTGREDSFADQDVDKTVQPEKDDDFEERNHKQEDNDYTRRGSRDVSDKTQRLSEHGIPQVDSCQEIENDSARNPFESILSSEFQGGKQISSSWDHSYESEPVIYRSTVQFSPKSEERHVVSATLQVSPLKISSKSDLDSSTNLCFGADSTHDRPNIEKSLRFNNTTIVLETSNEKYSANTHSKSIVPPTGAISKILKNGARVTTREIQENSVISSTKSHPIPQKHFLNSVKNSYTNSDEKSQISNSKHLENRSIVLFKPKNTNPSTVISKPQIPKILLQASSDSDESDELQSSIDTETYKKCYDVSCPSEELEIVKNILANLDFRKYKRRHSLQKMEEKTSKPPRGQKSSSVKLKDFFDLLKPSSDNSSGSNKRPFALCRSSSFSNAETITSDKSSPNFFLQDEESDGISPLPDETKKMSTLPRRKSPSRQSFTKSSRTPPVPAVASCPSIVKLESPKLFAKDHRDLDIAQDEGLVSDSEAGSGAYVAAYISCITASLSSSGRRGHVRSSSDNVTSVSSMPEVSIKKTVSTEKLWSSVTSRLNGSEKRKRRKGIGCKQSDGVSDQEPAKSSTGRSLTYPPQRKSSTSEEEQDFTSVDSNGLKSLKLLTVGLIDSGSDSKRLLSDLSLADSHLCPSEGTMDESYLDVVDSVMHSPNDAQHLSVDDHSSGSGKTHKKKHHSDPGGEACTSNPGDGFMADARGTSRSEPDLKGNEVTPRSSSSYSSVSSETSTRATQTHDDGHHLKLVIDSKKGQGSKHIRAASGGSLTSGATPHSRFQFPDTDTSSQRLSIDQSLSPKSPQEQRRYSKRRLRGPYGEMLEEEMRKSGEKQKPAYNDLSFLQELCESKGKAQEGATETENVAAPVHTSKPAMFLSSQSLDDASSTSSKNDSSMCVTPKRKISANYPLLTDGEPCAIASDEEFSPTNPEPPPELPVNNIPQVIESSSNTKSPCNPKPKEQKTISEPAKINDRQSDTRTHVVGELYDTEKSYVESLQILANKYMKPLKSPEYCGIVETGLVDEIFYQIPEILSHHEGFLELLRNRIVNWDSKQKVGDVFVEAFTKKNVSETYTAFINNWKSAKDAIKLATQAKPAFARFLEHMSREHKGKLTLDALLIMPVQRIPRYELLIKELLKHTHIDHPDHHPLVEAQKEVHDLALKINRMEREAFQLEQMQQRVRDIEQLIDGVIDLVQPDRDFIRHEIVAMPGGLGAKKERCLFLFSDVLLITSMKRKSTTMRKPSSTSSISQNALSCLEMNKYKLLTKFSLDNLDIAKSTDIGLKKLLKEIEGLEQDIALLNQISELIANLNNHHQALEDVIKDALNSMAKHLTEKQNTDSHLVSLELNVTTQESIDSLTIQFANPEKKTVWEAAFNEAKQKLALSTDRRPPPEFMHPLPIRKTRAGLQFTCATATLGLNQQGLRDVWVCNSDGYVGQVCVLSLMPEPAVMSCNGVCNARIISIASVPAANAVTTEKSKWKPNLPDNVSGVSVEVEEVEEELDDERTNNGNIQLDSDTSDDDDDTESTDDEKVKDESRKRGNSIPKDEYQEEMDNKQPTMWLGTEDGCIHVYNCNDSIRTKKNKIKIQLAASILCIIYLDNKVFVSVANGEIHAYKKDPNGGWCTCESQKVVIHSSSAPVTRMIAVAGKLWCGCQNTINILNTGSLQVEHSFAVGSDSTRTVLGMATSGFGVWITLHHSAILRLFHATSYCCLFDLNVAPAVTKMLAGCDDIIRQHKAACLRVTSLLACRDLLWVGTSAGVVLTLPLPHLTSTTTSLENTATVSGLPYGHTGHVRFLTCVEMTPGTSLDSAGYNKYAIRSLRSKEGTSGRRASTGASAISKLMVISGGDGYEDFQNSGLGEAAGRDDSTNHLLLWQV